MTSDEFESQKKEIEARLGKPEFDFDRTPLNESATQIAALRTRKRIEAARDKKLADKEAGQSQSPDSLPDFVKQVPSERLRQAMNKALPPIFVEEHDLKGFSQEEKNVIVTHYTNRELNHQQLGDRLGLARQTVTSVLNSREFKLLQLKYFEKEAPEQTRLALLHLLHDNDQKTAHRLAEHYGIIKAEKTDINISSKPIEDAEAIKLLKELGDKLSGETKD